MATEPTSVTTKPTAVATEPTAEPGLVFVRWVWSEIYDGTHRSAEDSDQTHRSAEDSARTHRSTGKIDEDMSPHVVTTSECWRDRIVV